MPEYNLRTPSTPPSQPPVVPLAGSGATTGPASAPPASSGALGPHQIDSVQLHQASSLPAPLAGLQNTLRSLADSFSHAVRAAVDQLRSVFGSSSGPAVPRDAAQRLQTLVGRSVDPKVAEQLMHVLSFDGIGRLVGPKAGARALNGQEWAALEGGLQARSLTQTNAAGPRDAARTEREVLLDMDATLRRARSTVPAALQPRVDEAIAQIKSQWLNFKAEAGQASSAQLLEQVADRFQADAPELAQAARGLAAEAGKAKAATQAYDNTFGRQFESALVHEMVKQPPAPVVAAARQMGEFLFAQVAALPADAQAKMLKTLADTLGHDPRPWHAETPDVGRFLAQPTLATLEAMLKPTNPSGYDVVKLSWVGVKASISFPPSHPAPWMAQANDNYGSVVTSARSQKDALMGMGTKIQSQAAARIQQDIRAIFAPRLASADPVERTLAEMQQGFVRQAFDPISFSANTPAALGKALTELEAQFQGVDPQVVDLFRHHRTELAKVPDQDADFAMVHSSLDNFDQAQVASKGQRFQPAQTSGYGTGLAHQPALVGGENWGKGLAVQGKTTLDMDRIKAFDANALAHEMNSVNGPSGSTNIMTFMYLQMQKTNPALNLQDAFAGTMMFLTFDGGHSLPESVGTFRSITADTRPTQAGGKPTSDHDAVMGNRRQVLENSVLAYGELNKLFGDPATAAGVSGAVDRAWQRTQQTFEAVHAQRMQA